MIGVTIVYLSYAHKNSPDDSETTLGNLNIRLTMLCSPITDHYNHNETTASLINITYCETVSSAGVTQAATSEIFIVEFICTLILVSVFL